MVINGMHGLGDNIYQRAFVREIKSIVHLVTSWPQLYSDLNNVLPVKPTTRLRTQRKNISKQPDSTWNKVSNTASRKIMYGGALIKGGSIMAAMAKCFNVTAKTFDLPKFDNNYKKEKYAVIRPVTVRSEWENIARNPEPIYIQSAVEELKKKGYHTISVADLQDDEEWAIDLPECDETKNNGEFNFEELMGLVQGASLIVGGVGWIVPAAIAAGVPLITVMGGNGGHNAPEKLTGYPMNTENTRWLKPDNYCMCTNKLHKCNKTISDFTNKFRHSMELLCSNN